MTPDTPLRAPPTSLIDYLDVVVPGLPPSLLADGDLERLRHVARYLPAALQSFTSLEFRLDDESAGVDMEVCADANSGGREILAGRNPRIGLPEAVWSHPNWKRIRDFATQWAEPGHPLHGDVSDVWLEFDLPSSRTVATPPDPSFFFCPPSPPRDAPAGTWQRPGEELLRNAFHALLGHPLPAETVECLRMCLRALPAHAHVFAAGMMLARNDFRMRLVLENLSAEEILAFLKAVRPAQDGHVRESLEWSRGLIDFLRLNIDIGAEVGETVGLELYLHENAPREVMCERWALLFDQLVSRGLCLPSRREAMLGSMGSRRSRELGEHWPRDLARMEQALGMESLLAWQLGEVKLVCRPGEVPRAKAYVLLWNAWAWR